MSTTSLFDRIRNIMNELEKSDMIKLGQAGSPAVEGSKHQTAKTDDGTTEQTTGSHYEENTEFLGEDNIDEKPDIESESQLGDANEDLPEDLGATLAGESETEQPKKNQTDETGHPAKATKTAFQKRLENSSLNELFNIARQLIKEEASVKKASANTDTVSDMLKDKSKMAEYLIAGLVKGAKDAADLTAGSIEALVKLAQEELEEEKEKGEPTKEEKEEDEKPAAPPPKEEPAKEEPAPEESEEGETDETAGKELTEDELNQLEQYIDQLLAEGGEKEEEKEEEEEEKPEKDILDRMSGTPSEPVGLQVPPEVATADNSSILNASVDAMGELGVTPDMLSKTGEVGRGLAKMASDWVFTGKYKPRTKRGQTHEVIKDYMKRYITELFKRSRPTEEE